MTDVTATVDTYIDMWNEIDPDKRAELIERAWAPDAHYVDPVLEGSGHAGLSTMVAGVHAQFPGQTFRRTTAVDEHHGLIRFGWELGADGGPITVAGIDIAVVGTDGRFQRVAGFFGDLVPVAG